MLECREPLQSSQLHPSLAVDGVLCSILIGGSGLISVSGVTPHTGLTLGIVHATLLPLNTKCYIGVVSLRAIKHRVNEEFSATESGWIEE